MSKACDLGGVLGGVPERRVDAALGRAGMAAGRVQLRDDADVRAGVVRLDGRAHARAAGADDQDVVRRFHVSGRYRNGSRRRRTGQAASRTCSRRRGDQASRIGRRTADAEVVGASCFTAGAARSEAWRAIRARRLAQPSAGSRAARRTAVPRVASRATRRGLREREVTLLRVEQSAAAGAGSRGAEPSAKRSLLSKLGRRPADGPPRQRCR